MNELNVSAIDYPEKGILKKLIYLVKYHFHVTLFFYVWFGVFVCGLVAPQDRVAELGSSIITKGWHISALSMVFILPWPVLYVVRFIISKNNQHLNGQ